MSARDVKLEDVEKLLRAQEADARETAASRRATAARFREQRYPERWATEEEERAALAEARADLYARAIWCVEDSRELAELLVEIRDDAQLLEHDDVAYSQDELWVLKAQVDAALARTRGEDCYGDRGCTCSERHRKEGDAQGEEAPAAAE